MAIAPWTSAARSRPCSAFSWKPTLSRAIDEVAGGIVLDVLTFMRGRECLAEIEGSLGADAKPMAIVGLGGMHGSGMSGQPAWSCCRG
jgi:hypothetical protein